MDPVLINYASTNTDYIIASSFLSFCYLSIFIYSLHTLIRVQRFPLSNERKSISTFVLIFITLFSIGRKYLGFPIILFREFLSMNTFITRILFNLSFTLFSLILSRISYYLIDIYVNLSYWVNKKRILKVSSLFFYNFCVFQLCFKSIFIFWPDNFLMIENSYDKTMGLINFVFMIISMVIYVFLILLVHNKLGYIQGNIIIKEIKSNLQYLILIVLPVLLYFIFAVIVGVFWADLNTKKK